MVLQPMALATPVDNSLPEWQVDARSLGMEPRTSRYDTLSMGSAKSTRLMPEKDLHPIIWVRTAPERITGDRDTGRLRHRQSGTPADRAPGWYAGRPGWYTGMVHRMVPRHWKTERNLLNCRLLLSFS